MATKKYQWRATTDYKSDTTLSYGVIPNTSETWQDEEAGGSGSGTWQYWYRDANVAVGGQYSDANSSRVVVTVTQSWTTSIDQRNYLTVTVNTTIDSIVRDDLRGSNQNTPGRNIQIYEEEGGASVLTATDNQLAVAHTIFQGPRTLEPETFTLAPGENATRSSLFLHNSVPGYPSYDDIWVGVQFRNPLPADYRPGATLKGDNEYGPTAGVWVTHNDKDAGCHVLSDTDNLTWKEMRTYGNGTVQTKAPSILTTDDDPGSWHNQKELGKFTRT